LAGGAAFPLAAPAGGGGGALAAGGGDGAAAPDGGVGMTPTVEESAVLCNSLHK
jgi:hypothetical protein